MARLAVALRRRAELLEARLARENSRARTLQGLAEQLSASMTAMDTRHLVFQSAGLKRLADAETALASSEVDVDKIRHELLGARGREQGLSARAALFRMKEARKASEDEALEAVMNMPTKACRKIGVLK